MFGEESTFQQALFDVSSCPIQKRAAPPEPPKPPEPPEPPELPGEGQGVVTISTFYDCQFDTEG